VLGSRWPARLLHVIKLRAVFERCGDEGGAHRVRRVIAIGAVRLAILHRHLALLVAAAAAGGSFAVAGDDPHLFTALGGVSAAAVSDGH